MIDEFEYSDDENDELKLVELERAIKETDELSRVAERFKQEVIK